VAEEDRTQEGRLRSGARDARRSRWRLLALVLLLSTYGVRGAAASPDLPAPAYDNTFYAFVYDAPLGTDQDYAASRDTLLARVESGPYARVGFTTYYAIDLPWDADLANPVLTSPSRAALDQLLARLSGDGLVYHVSAMLGMSRFFWKYADAKEADRRNAQWYSDNLVLRVGAPERKTPDSAWVTPSRYARKLRRHMEVKTRAFAALFEDLRATYPDTLISASGDAEAELSDLRFDANLPFDGQVIADYSPFAILEFRDWLLRIGLYAADGPFAGQGYKRKKAQKFTQGPTALTPENLEKFNKAFGTAFTSWDLEYFPWSLDDPIDGDPHAIKYKKYKKAAFAPLPTSGANFVAGGFDAPRNSTDPSKLWWKMWRKFRQRMIANFAIDVATWMTTPGPHGEPALAPDRWYSHQIPADYLAGTPAGVTPLPRLQTSASTLATALVPPNLGSPGLTILDRFELADFGPPGGYNRTSAYAFDAMEALELPNWGIPEYSPSWAIDVAPDTNGAGMVAQWNRAYAAGAHMAGFTPWPHFAGTVNGDALGVFFDGVADAPRAPGYLPFERDAFVTQLYADLLHRAPTAGELSTRVNGIADGTVPRPQLFAQLLAASEGKETALAVVRMYLALLGRLPTITEFAQKTALLTAPNGNAVCNTICHQQRRQLIVDAMASTTEFKNRFGGSNPTNAVFVGKLFELILGRSPTSSEQSTWEAALAGITTRASAARQIVDNAEAVTRYDADVAVAIAYAGLLARMPVGAEQADWRTRVTDGLSKRGLAQAFLVSPEYRARFAS
jgi:hypothetical protein